MCGCLPTERYEGSWEIVIDHILSFHLSVDSWVPFDCMQMFTVNLFQNSNKKNEPMVHFFLMKH